MKGKRLVLILPLLLAGCAAPDAGKTSAPVECHMETNSLTVAPPAGAGACTITISQTVTITPSTTATQTAETKVDATATIPAGGVSR